jgi:syntaxin 5
MLLMLLHCPCCCHSCRQVHNERRQLFSAQPDGGAGLLETAPLLGGGSSSSHTAAADGSSSSSSSRPTAAGLFGQQQQQQQQGGAGGGGMLMQQQYAPQESAYSQSRAEALQNVETTIVELGSIFTQLAEMVAAQVCSRVVVVVGGVEGGHWRGMSRG